MFDWFSWVPQTWFMCCILFQFVHIILAIFRCPRYSRGSSAQDELCRGETKRSLSIRNATATFEVAGNGREWRKSWKSQCTWHSTTWCMKCKFVKLHWKRHVEHGGFQSPKADLARPAMSGCLTCNSLKLQLSNESQVMSKLYYIVWNCRIVHFEA